MLAPFLSWMREYSAKTFRADFLAGMTVAVILTPQAMAYALLAGLPPIVGFYAALIGAVVASLWGSSRQVSTGPVALISFLVFSTLVPLAEPQSAKFIALAAGLAIVSGLILFLLGFFRLGFIMRFIPHSVIIGFASAAALIIAITQVPALLGFSVERYAFMLPSLWSIGTNIFDTHITTALIGIGAMTALLGLRRFRPGIPGALIVLIAAVIGSYLFGFEALGVMVIGSIPALLPTLAVPEIAFADWLALLSKAWVIALVGFVETYAIAKSISSRTKQHVDVDQELVGQGLANMAVGFFKGYPVSGSFSRTAVNIAAGSQTGISSVVAAVAVMLILFLISPILYYIPLAVLAAIVIVSVTDLIDIGKIRDAYRISSTDGIVAMVTFGTAFLLKPDDAILIGIIVALALILHRIVWARVRVLGLETEWNILQGVETSAHVQTFLGVLIVRAETSAFYGNIEYIIRKVDDLIMAEETKSVPVKTLVLECSSINYIDLGGAELLHEYLLSLKKDGVAVFAIYMSRSVRERLEKIGALNDITLVHNIAEMRSLARLDEPTGPLEEAQEECLEVGEKFEKAVVAKA